MLKIGEFSKIAQVSIKTLRYYDQMGLLNPSHIDRFTGYRYYALSQLDRLNRILALKDLDFSLDQIQGLLNVNMPEETMRGMLENKSSELRERLNEDQARLLRVENRLKQLAEGSGHLQAAVVMKSAPHLLLATIRQTLPTQSNLISWQNSCLKLIHTYLADKDLNAQGPDILIYHQDEYRETDLDVEVGTVVRETRHSQEKILTEAGLQFRVLPGANQLASAIHQTKTVMLWETYALLAEWTQSNGYHATGPWRELIYQQEEPIQETVVEVQRPVMKANQYYSQLEVISMEPKIVKKDGFTMVGLRYFGTNQNQEISRMWGQFNQRMEDMGGLPNDTGEAAIGLCITPEDAPVEDGFEYVAGLPVSKVGDVPEGFVVRGVPAYTYAVFTHKGDLASLAGTYEYIYETWLPQSGYQLAAKLDFEYYNEEFKDFAPDSVFYIYIPIEKV
jgi:predicted transcriptional regulator YdeE/DNA-binding transcriptional MerR regulator